MTTTTPDRGGVADVAAGLRSALDELARAMASGDAEAVLAAEPGLQAAVARTTGASLPLTAEVRDQLLHDIGAARAALARCRALGAATALVAGDTLEALGRAPSYSRQGAGPSRGLRGRGLEARV